MTGTQQHESAPPETGSADTETAEVVEITANERPPIIEVAGKSIDIRKFQPVTLGDLEDLEAASLLGPNAQLVVKGLKQAIDFMFIVCRKIEPAITRDDIRALDPTQLDTALQTAGALVGPKEERAEDRPTDSSDGN